MRYFDVMYRHERTRSRMGLAEAFVEDNMSCSTREVAEGLGLPVAIARYLLEALWSEGRLIRHRAAIVAEPELNLPPNMRRWYLADMGSDE